MARHAFDFVPLPDSRSTAKPRSSGLSMMIDWGIGLNWQRDVLEIAGAFIDLAKIAVGTSRIYEEQALRQKLDLYRQHAVRPFLGGMFQEYVFATMGADRLPAFFDEAQRVGFEWIEISDNCVPLDPPERRRQITLAREHGLRVLGEVGSKTDKNEAGDLIAQARDCLQSGASLVLVEGAELVEEGRPRVELLDAIRQSLDVAKVMFELPGPWIRGATLCDIHDLKKLLVGEFGPDVNLANIMPDDVIETESLRVGLGVVGPRPPA